MMKMQSDTIAAISTALSPSGIGIIRISGTGAIEAADRIYRSKGGRKRLVDQPTHTVHYGFICDGEEVLDEVLVTLMRAPKSFTAEDVVEINCHGGICALRRVLDAVLKQGVRPAEPGEFTKRAFLNGRIDLSQAESVIDVINAKNSYALKSSVSQLRGSVREAVGSLRSRILEQLAFIEAALDDPEHISLDGYDARLKEQTEKLLAELRRLIASSENGRLLREGIQTVILGKPNAGKSSLLNVLVGSERAIVTDIAGTTRDLLEETVNLNGITLNIIDTAGIRHSADVVEQIGVDRARERAQNADLILYVVDSSTALDENDREILSYLKGKKAVVILNKSDLPPVTTGEDIRKELEAVCGADSCIAADSEDSESRDAADGNRAVSVGYFIVEVSTKQESGIDALEDEIRRMFCEGELSYNDEVCITNARQKACLCEAAEALNKVLESIACGMPEDFYSIDLMSAYSALGEVTGEAVGEDLVDKIFSSFCMGK